MISKKACVSLSEDDAQLTIVLVMYPLSVQLLTQLLRGLTALIDFEFSLRKSPVGYFKQLTKALQPMNLQRLKIAHIKTRYRYLALFLRSCKATLRSLTLELITLNEHECFETILLLMIHELKLRDCAIRGMNAGDQGLCFHKFNLQRPHTDYNIPTEFDNEPWVWVYANPHDGYGFKLCVDDGDKMDHWLHKAMYCVEVGRLWSGDRYDF